ncbi:hypothetical protein CSUI_009549 [Cystoisospora suis]|uniref:Transmembrane protein n=1 Tax=Cystoisospora suis TaxID=483139 RepID=A0A2C6KJH1_9APIC|nr:hypothetical protein CSUI_009549 [Cystoisospora suis]
MKEESEPRYVSLIVSRLCSASTQNVIYWICTTFVFSLSLTVYCSLSLCLCVCIYIMCMYTSRHVYVCIDRYGSHV